MGKEVDMFGQLNKDVDICVAEGSSKPRHEVGVE